MTLVEVVRAIEEVASSQPAVNMIVENDFSKLSNIGDALYGAFGFQQEPHTEEIGGDTIGYHFTLIYADRVIEDDRNELDIQSTALRTLSNILHALHDRDIWTVGEVAYQPFRQSYADDCAGMFCDVILRTAKEGVCADKFVKKTVKIV